MSLSITITSLTLLVTISSGPGGSAYSCTISTLMILLVCIAIPGTMLLLSFMEDMKKLMLMAVESNVIVATLDSVKVKYFTASKVFMKTHGVSSLPGGVIGYGGSSTGNGAQSN